MILFPIFQAILSLLNGIPVLSLESASSLFEVVYDVVRVVCYLIPVYAFIPLLQLSVGIIMFMIITNTIRLAWNLIGLS